jgi:hypothetical protein
MPAGFYRNCIESITALKFGERYFFHVWDLRYQQLYECTVQSVRGKIPHDNATGRWTVAEIPVANV